MSSNINLYTFIPKLLAFFVLVITLLYPPFVFFQFVNEVMRIVLFAIILISLFTYHLISSYKIRKLSTIGILWLFIIIYFIASINTNFGEGLRTAVGYSMILAFAMTLYSILQSERNHVFFTTAFNIYVKLFFLIPIFCCINFVLNLVSPSVNFLTGSFSQFIYNYQASPFGLSIPRSILGINFTRNFFFFIEPVYLAIFYLVNIFIIGKSVEKHSRLFIIINIIGGFLTASYLFFLGYLIVMFLKLRPLVKTLVIFIAGLLLLVVSSWFNDFFMESSYADRLLRVEIAMEILENFDVERLFVGTGYFVDYGFDRGVSSGILASFIEGGLIGLCIPLMMVFVICWHNKALLVLFLLSLVLFESFKLPFLWFAIIIASEASKRTLALKTYVTIK